MTQSPSTGHNSLSPASLRNYCERIESLIESRKAINADIKQVTEEAEEEGFDKKVLKEMIKLRSMDSQDRIDLIEMRDMYLQALGLLG